jgi:predicted peroxiredoxin
VHVPEEDVGNVDLDIIKRYQMSHIEDDILFYICLYCRLRSENVVDKGKNQEVKSWKMNDIGRLVSDPLPIGISILMCNCWPTPKRVCLITLIDNIQISGQITMMSSRDNQTNRRLHRMSRYEIKD